MRFRPRYSLAFLFIVIAAIAVALGVYRYLNPRPAYQLPTSVKSGEEWVSYAFDHAYGSLITDEMVSAAPTWDRHNPNPPLSAEDAIVLADAVRKRLIDEKKLRDASKSDGGKWIMIGAVLTPFNADAGLWYWRVDFEYALSGTGPPNALQLAVLMNGKVIEPAIGDYPN